MRRRWDGDDKWMGERVFPLHREFWYDYHIFISRIGEISETVKVKKNRSKNTSILIVHRTSRSSNRVIENLKDIQAFTPKEGSSRGSFMDNEFAGKVKNYGLG